MAIFNKVYSLVQDLGTKVHNFNVDTFKVALSDTAPALTNTVLANITQIAAGGGYVSGGFTLDSVVYSNTLGVSKLTIADEVFTATGPVGPFRYIVIYNDSATNKELLGWYDYGTSITLGAGETFTIDFDATNGVMTVG